MSPAEVLSIVVDEEKTMDQQYRRTVITGTGRGDRTLG